MSCHARGSLHLVVVWLAAVGCRGGGGRGSGGDTPTRGGRAETAAGVTGGARWLCSSTQRHARQPELIAWVPELDTLSTKILRWWPKPNHWRPNQLLVPRVELLPIRSNYWWPISASCRAHGEQNDLKIPRFQIVVQIIVTNSRYTKSHSCV